MITVLKVNHEPKDISTFLDVIIESGGERGKRVVVDLYRATYYKRAILAIALYMPKQWIYNHAVELKTVFDLLKKK